MLFARIRETAGRLTLLGWVLAGIVAVICAVYLIFAVTRFQVDLAVYRDGARAAWSSPDLYDLLFPPVGLPFTYTPFAALIFTPLAFLPRVLAQLLWAVLTLVSGIVYCAVCVRDYAGQRYQRQAVPLTLAVIITVFISDPFRIGMGFGQVNVMLALLVVLDLSNRSGRLPQGVLIGIAAAIKLVPLFLIAYFIVTRRFRSAAITAGSFALAAVISFAAFPQASAQYWSGMVVDSGRVGGIAYISNQSIQGMLIRALGSPPQAQLPWLAIASLVAITALAVCWRLFPVFPAFANALALATMLLVSPVSWTHHWIFILPLLLVAITPEVHLSSLAVKVIAWVLAAAMVVGAIWLVPNTGDQEYRHTFFQFALGNSYVWLTLLLTATLSVIALRRASQTR